MAAFQVVILLSMGTFQAALPDAPARPSATFADSGTGVTSFVKWLEPLLPAPTFAQAPLDICLVGAEAFSDAKPPYLPKPLYGSEEPLHSLEPYSATFHYVESKGVVKLKAKRDMNDALRICSQARIKGK